MTNACVIDSIVEGTIKSYIVYENEDYIAFLDHRPVCPGHTLIAPKKHIQNLYELPEHLIQSYFLLVQKIGRAVELGMQAEGTFVAINNTVSQSIPHLHTHVVPRNKGDGLKGFFWPRVSYQNEEHILRTFRTPKSIFLN